MEDRERYIPLLFSERKFHFMDILRVLHLVVFRHSILPNRLHNIMLQHELYVVLNCRIRDFAIACLKCREVVDGVLGIWEGMNHYVSYAILDGRDLWGDDIGVQFSMDAGEDLNSFTVVGVLRMKFVKYSAAHENQINYIQSPWVSQDVHTVADLLRFIWYSRIYLFTLTVAENEGSPFVGCRLFT